MILSVDLLSEIVIILLEKEEIRDRMPPVETFDFYWRVEWSQMVDAQKRPDNFLLGQYSFELDMLDNAYQGDSLYFGDLDYVVSGLLCIHCDFLKIGKERISRFQAMALEVFRQFKKE